MSGFRTEPDGLVVTVNGDDIAKFNSSGTLTVGGFPVTTEASKINTGTPQATTSGTFAEFSGVPSWVKRITVCISGVSTSGVSLPLLQIGPVSGVEASAYTSAVIGGAAGNTVGGTTNTAGFVLAATLGAGFTCTAVLTKSTNADTWHISGTGLVSSGATGYFIVGTKSLAGVLEKVRLTTVNGTDTFDAGSVNILWE